MADAKETHTEEEGMETADEMRVYEIGFHLIPIIPEDDLAAATTRLKGRVEALGGACIAESFPQKITLTYQMEHETGEERKTFDTAYFGWFAFTALPAQVEALQQEFDSDEQVLRFICTHTTREAAERQRELAQYHTQTPQTADESEKAQAPATDGEDTPATKPEASDVSDADIDRAIGTMTQ